MSVSISNEQWDEHYKKKLRLTIFPPPLKTQELNQPLFGQLWLCKLCIYQTTHFQE